MYITCKHVVANLHLEPIGKEDVGNRADGNRV